MILLGAAVATVSAWPPEHRHVSPDHDHDVVHRHLAAHLPSDSAPTHVEDEDGHGPIIWSDAASAAPAKPRSTSQPALIVSKHIAPEASLAGAIVANVGLDPEPDPPPRSAHPRGPPSISL